MKVLSVLVLPLKELEYETFYTEQIVCRLWLLFLTYND